MSGGQVNGDLSQALLPTGRVGVPLRGVVPPAGDRVQGLGVDEGEAALDSLLAATG